MCRFKLDYLRDIFWPAATSSNKVAFLKVIDEIKQTSLEAHAYLSKISLETWAVHAFDTICKTDHNTNNVVEAFNGWMNKNRTLPMLTMIEKVIWKFMKLIQDRYEATMSWESNIPPAINRKLQKPNINGYFDPLRCGEYEFEARASPRKRDNDEDYVNDYLKKAAYLRTYSNNIHAISDKNLWLNENFETILPPIRKMGVGKPRLSRRRGSTEPKKVQRSVGFKCGICKEVGHNSRTCKNTSTTERQRRRNGEKCQEAVSEMPQHHVTGNQWFREDGEATLEAKISIEHLELYKDIGLQDNGAGLKGPTDNSNDAVGNKQVATDRFMLEHFCK
ncbi:hypothetical protein LWI28_011389 [Acer negundo]|uniref:Uncharacterized protein n=1 Tax=Acer negundo TaxID=4023 RepID=A0AAD5ICD7_ACENE|nr:hypothetical protein LWI28_011389 [Acer negundo]